jgi:GMP synthase-like glutamine amidotransferase
MMLLINICKNSLHYYEFIKPIEDILKKNTKFKTVHYKQITKKLIQNSEKIIISGTSLKDNEFLEHLDYFKWIKSFDKPLFGICGGMHILGLVFNGKLKKQQEIGLTEVIFEKEFLGLNGVIQVYELHNFYIGSKQFDLFAKSKNCPQAIKHKCKPLYGVLFHPEVRTKNLIKNFVEFKFF